MIRALLAGSKTQTRRIVKARVGPLCALHEVPAGSGDWKSLIANTLHDAGGPSFRCPYGVPGDRLWVREAWRYGKEFDDWKPRDIVGQAIGMWFEANGSAPPWMGKLRPGMFMPRWASRTTLEIVGVRVERLQDISEADCIAEGAPGGHGAIPGYGYSATPQEHYRHIWEQINGAGSWALNPFVWVVEFKRATTA